ncbi:MAG: hypothetical protein AAF216_13330 [Pseudomonadota bacterium]
MFKLHKRDEDGAVRQYHEVWADPENRRLICHWGEIGQEGEVEAHRIWLVRSLEEQVEALLQPARDAGFSELGAADYTSLVVASETEDEGAVVDLDLRDAMADRIQEILGWTGLGHCDRAGTTDHSMELICLVVNFDLAKSVLTEALAHGEFADTSLIIRA